MPRGDIRNIRFRILNGSEVFTDLDEIFFSVKRSVSAKNVLFQKRLSREEITLDGDYFIFKIEPADTDDLDYGTYVFDIELIKGDTIKQTSVGRFILTEEVTFATNEDD